MRGDVPERRNDRHQRHDSQLCACPRHDSPSVDNDQRSLRPLVLGHFYQLGPVVTQASSLCGSLS